MASLWLLCVKRRSTLVSMDMVIQNCSRCKFVCSALHCEETCKAGPRHRAHSVESNRTRARSKPNPTPNKIPPLSFEGSPANGTFFLAASKASLHGMLSLDWYFAA